MGGASPRGFTGRVMQQRESSQHQVKRQERGCLACIVVVVLVAAMVLCIGVVTTLEKSFPSSDLSKSRYDVEKPSTLDLGDESNGL